MKFVASWPVPRLVCVLLPLVLVLVVRAAVADPSSDRFWPQWRGPLATGVAPLADPPLRPGAKPRTSSGKLPFPAKAIPRPLSGATAFILSAIATGKKTEIPAVRPNAPNEIYRWVVLCLDRAIGKVLWQKTAREETPHEGHQQNNTYASASPVTDGNLLLAYFGSRGLHCYDFDGNLKWEKDFGKMRTRMGFGEGSSPALTGDTVVVNWDTEGDDFIVALDKRPGREFWRTRATRRPAGPPR